MMMLISISQEAYKEEAKAYLELEMKISELHVYFRPTLFVSFDCFFT